MYVLSDSYHGINECLICIEELSVKADKHVATDFKHPRVIRAAVVREAIAKRCWDSWTIRDKKTK